MMTSGELVYRLASRVGLLLFLVAGFSLAGFLIATAVTGPHESAGRWQARQREIFTEGRRVGENLRLDATVCPYATGSLREAWMKGFVEGRLSLEDGK